MQPSKTLFIIDVMPFLYRGHFVFLRNPRVTSTGITTSALIGFANGIVSILKDWKPTHAALAMDPTGPTFRHEAYPPYKAQREKMPEDLAANIPYAFELAEALRLPVIRKEGFEADDVMGSLAVRAAAEGFDVYLATPDKDAAQLVAPHIRLFRPGRAGEDADVYDEARVKEHWGLTSPAQMIDWLALAGDASDNIPGIKGIGEKTASALLAQYGSVENLVAHAADIKGKTGEKVAAGAEDAKMSKFLTTIRTDVPLEVSLDSLARQEPDRERLAAVCAKYELNHLAKNLLGADAALAPAPSYKKLADVPHDYRLVTTEEDASALARVLEAAPMFAFDTETTGTDAHTVDLVGVSFATEKGKDRPVLVRRATGPVAAPPLRRRVRRSVKDAYRAERKVRHHRPRPLRHQVRIRRARHDAGALRDGRRRAARDGRPRARVPRLRPHPLRGGGGREGARAGAADDGRHPAGEGLRLRRRGRRRDAPARRRAASARRRGRSAAGA